VQGFVPVKGGSASKRSADDDGDDDYDVPAGSQKDDSGDDGVMFTTFTAPHAKIGTIKKEESAGDDDSAATKDRKFKAPSTKKQNGKKQKHTNDDDAPSKTATDDHPKATPSPSKSKSEDKKKEDKKAQKDTKFTVALNSLRSPSTRAYTTISSSFSQFPLSHTLKRLRLSRQTHHQYSHRHRQRHVHGCRYIAVRLFESVPVWCC
jgi:hypothetical protein